MKKLVMALIILLFVAVDADGQLHYKKKYGVECTISFALFSTASDGISLAASATDDGDECTIRIDEGAEATCTNDFVDEGVSQSLTLTAAEMQGGTITITIEDDTDPKEWGDAVIIIDTYGNASAEHAFDLDDADPGVDIVKVAGDAVADGGDGLLDVNIKEIDGSDVPVAKATLVTDGVSLAAIRKGLVLTDTTIAAYTSNTSFTITSGPADDTNVVGYMCVIIDQSDATQYAVGRISAYTTAANTVTLESDPGGTFTFANGDYVYIRPCPRGIDTVAILDDTDDIGAAGAGLTDLGGMSTSMKAEVESEVADELQQNNLDHLMKTAVANNADMTAEVTDGTVLSNIMTSDSDTSGYTVADDSLEGIADTSTAAAIADAVWDEAIAGHLTNATFGWLLNLVGLLR